MEEDVSSIRDGFTAWVKSDPETILRCHVATVTRAYAEFCEAPALPPKDDSVLKIGILDLSVERKELSKGTLRENGASSLYKKPSSTSSTTFSRTASM